MNPALKRLLDQILRIFAPVLLIRAKLTSETMPRPTGAPEAHAPGEDPDRLLLIGGGIAVGFGVLSHDLSLAGHIARQISAETGRGVTLDIIADPILVLHSVPATLAQTTLERYDAVILTFGVTDALRRTPGRQWREQLLALIDTIRDRTAAHVHIFVVGVQPVRNVATLHNLAGRLAELHGRALDRESMRVCATRDCATFVPFDPVDFLSDEGTLHRSSRVYKRWAAQISPAVSAVLQENHPLGDWTI